MPYAISDMREVPHRTLPGLRPPSPSFLGGFIEETRCDLSAELTVFVLTVGAPSFAECLKRLEAQDCRFNLEVIENVAPMSRALQCMLDRCRTRFFVQVDEDMLLYPHAIRSLYTRLAESPPDVAILTCHLFDAHAQRVIYGLKIYRHEIVRAYPYDDVESCEYDQIRRFTKDGFVDLRLPLEDHFRPSEITLGEHGSAVDTAIGLRALPHDGTEDSPPHEGTPDHIGDLGRRARRLLSEALPRHGRRARSLRADGCDRRSPGTGRRARPGEGLS